MSLGIYLLVHFHWNNRKLSKTGLIITTSSFSIYLLLQFFINALLSIDVLDYSNIYLSVFVLSVTSVVLPIGVDTLYNKIKKYENI